ncbi:hypothetical protein D049_1390A, partial [Vibrio parahaemolyticus VPTS-2010]
MESPSVELALTFHNR